MGPELERTGFRTQTRPEWRTDEYLRKESEGPHFIQEHGGGVGFLIEEDFGWKMQNLATQCWEDSQAGNPNSRHASHAVLRYCLRREWHREAAPCSLTPTDSSPSTGERSGGLRSRERVRPRPRADGLAFHKRLARISSSLSCLSPPQLCLSRVSLLFLSSAL